VIKILRNIFKSEFAKNTFTLLSGTTLSMGISIAISPVLTRLYSPEDFGMFALFTSIAGILTVFLNGKYDIAILLPEQDGEAIHLVFISIIITFIIGGLLLLFLFFIKDTTLPSNILRLSKWLFMLPLFLVLIGLYQALYYWSNRKKRYRSISLSRILSTITTSVNNVGFGLSTMKLFGLIAGQIIGQAMSCGVLIKGVTNQLNPFAKPGFCPRKICQTICSYRQFPLHAIPAALLNVLGHQLPILVLSYFFGTPIIGLYYFGYRLLNLPMNIIGNSFSDVAYQHTMVMVHQKQSLSVYMERMTAKLLTFSILPFLLFSIFGGVIFRIVFGKDWEMAGIFVQILSPYFLLRFLSSPITIFIQTGRTDLLLKWQIMFFLSTLVSLYLGGLLKSIFCTVALLSFSYSVCYFILILINFKLAQARFQNVTIDIINNLRELYAIYEKIRGRNKSRS